MFKKIFGFVLAAHLVVFAYFAAGSKKADADSASPAAAESEDVTLEASPLIPVESSPATSEAPESPAMVSSPAPQTDFSGTDAEAVELPPYVRLAELRSGIVVDLTNGKVLWSRDSARPVPIASMTKMMTGLLALEDVEARPEIGLATTVKVTDDAYRIGGSQVWLDPRESFSMESLLISVFVHSANDSSYLIGEFLEGGDMAKFVARMNARAQQLGMTETKFYNAHGLPEKEGNNVASCEDLARLAGALLRFEEARHWASLEQYVFRSDPDKPTILHNHNRLLGRCAGVDGLKTGYTKDAGYCTTVSCLRGGRRIVVVVTGFTSGGRRDDCAQDLIEWAYTQK